MYKVSVKEYKLYAVKLQQSITNRPTKLAP